MLTDEFFVLFTSYIIPITSSIIPRRGFIYEFYNTICDKILYYSQIFVPLQKRENN